MRTWRVFKWDNRPSETTTIPLDCPHCGREADFPIGPLPGGMIIAANGLTLIFDPPGYKPPPSSMPDEVGCRHCRRIFGKETHDEVPNVR